jgi:hypothetical protein
MARTTGPLLSFDASGSVGGAITFSKWKGRNYVRQLVIPSNPQTASQTTFRSMFKFLSQAWAAILAADQDTWDGLANADKVSDFNAYMAKNQLRWKQFLPPAKAWPAAESNLPGSVPVFSSSAGGVGQAQLDMNLTAVQDNWGGILYREFAATPTGAFTEVVAVFFKSTASATSYIDSPLAAGNWHYKWQPFSDDGVVGALSPEEIVAVT